NHVDCSDDGADRARLSTGDDGHRRLSLPLSSQGQSDRTGWKSHWLGTDRAEFHERRLFSWAALRHDGHRSKRFDQDRAGALQREQFGGSNYGPTSKALIDRVKEDSGPLAATNPSVKIPVDLVTTSA